MTPSLRVSAGLTGLLVAGGLLMAAYERAWSASADPRTLFWAGVALAVVSFVFGAAQAGLDVRSALLLCIGLAVVLSAPKFGRSPINFEFFDEMQHVRATGDLLAGGSLFESNPLNPLSARYPGLHLVTVPVARAADSSVFAGGNLVILAARILLLTALLTLYRRALASIWLGAIAVLLYAANPAFFFFDAQYSYESLALPISAAVLAIALSGEGDGPWRGALAFALVLATVVTHHISAAMLTVMLTLLAVSLRACDGPSAVARRLAMLALGAAVATVSWWVLAAPQTWRYLEKDVGGNLDAIPEFLLGRGAARAPFAGSPFPLPAYERFASYAGVMLLGLAFLAGARRLLRGRPRAGWAVAFSILGVMFFVSLPLQLLQASQASPITPRIWEFAFIGVAPIAAVGLRGAFTQPIAQWRAIGATAALVLIMAAGVMLRSGDNIRFPGPYIASGGPRAATPETIAAARWLKRHYGSGTRVMGDFTLAPVFGAYGDSFPVIYQHHGYRPWRVFFSQRLTGAGRYELDRSRTEFVVVDSRMGMRPAFGGYYFSLAEDSHPWRTIPRSFLRKFDKDGSFERIYDGGHVRIYRYRPLPEAGP